LATAKPRLLVFPQGTKSAPEHARKNRPGRNATFAAFGGFIILRVFFTSRNEREIRDAMKDTTKASGQWSVASNSFLAFHSKKVG
jgi:hypothetical protein